MYSRLAHQRLRWYTRASGNLVLQHWQVFVLACLVVPGPPVIALLALLATFLQSSVSPALSAAHRFPLALAIDAVAILWIMPQRQALSGGPFMRFVATLPTPRGVRLAVEGTLLAVANNAILLSAAIAAARMSAGGANAFEFGCFAEFLAAAALAQQAMLDRRFLALAGVVAADLSIALGMESNATFERGLWLGGAIVCLGAGAAIGYRFDRIFPRKWRALGARPSKWAVAAMSGHAPALLIQCKVLCAMPVQATLRLGAAITLALGANRLIAIFQFDSRSLPTAILAMALIGLLLAGLYRTLFNAHKTMARYQATLPVVRSYWAVRDTGFVLLLNGVVLVILLAPQIVQGLASLAVLAALATAAQALLVVFRWPTLHAGGGRLIYSIVLAGIWSGTAIAAVMR